jgi:CelD/BcsL family acetyltransferase involved in cellulose biosynthesis
MDCEMDCEPEDVGAEMVLPATWNEFLSGLKGKHRHEIRRKLRRLSEAGEIGYRHVEDPEQVKEHIDTFLVLFASNRIDKEAFMNQRMASFFRSLSKALAERHFLRLSFLDLDGTPVAAVMCFDYRSTLYLYNNGYDRQFGSMSVGLLSKVLSIKESIRRGLKKYDFLKGDEAYKLQLGGNPITLYRCRVRLV